MTKPMLFEIENIVGFPVCRESIETIVRGICELLRKKERPCSYFACLNPHSVEIAGNDPEFERALLDAEFLTADGIGVVYASRFFGGTIRERITGTDVFEHLNCAMNRYGDMSCFFLGSTDETLEKVCERMTREYPEIRIAGSYSPPFKPVFDVGDMEAMISQVNRAAPDVLWIGMTAPKQEKWMLENRGRLDVTFAGPIGAVFDFYAGNIRRAGPLWQKLGLEWLPRLLQEPRRLWRRNLISSPVFLYRCWRYRRLSTGPHMGMR